ncbi:sigma-54 interaction domain-containing protein [Saccharicrinis sp. FJH54]|uniref:sigma-54 interaction domain-containing protein n=1 Tax=Saccharicrinis sp. FJH54 TaxID=3344665 RepID=UPI0035D4690D
MNIQQVKQRFGVIGNAYGLNRAIDIAVQVASTDLSVLITGESGTGKEIIPQIIHQYGSRKHGAYIPVNCGAIPEGTIDSELFGHEKGAFTGAHTDRKGYFEVADGGTIFLDEVGDLPLSTQVRLLRVLETGEFIRVGSSKIQKTDVRVVAATNLNMAKGIREGKFREDLYYRLNTVPIAIPPLRERTDDIVLLFRKFAQDFAEKYRMPNIRLTEEAKNLLIQYRWPGNIRQLKNVTEQISVIEPNREITPEILKQYIPFDGNDQLPALYNADKKEEKTFHSEREILYQILFDMKNDMNDLKKLVHEIIDKENIDVTKLDKDKTRILNTISEKKEAQLSRFNQHDEEPIHIEDHSGGDYIEDTEVYVEESLSLIDKEIELIKKALDKHNGKRKNAAQELGISERTLYRKIKEYEIDQ